MGKAVETACENLEAVNVEHVIDEAVENSNIYRNRSDRVVKR